MINKEKIMRNFIKILSVIWLVIGGLLMLFISMEGVSLVIYLMGLLISFALLYGWGIIVDYYSAIRKLGESSVSSFRLLTGQLINE